MTKLMDRLSNTWVDRLVSRFYAALELKVMAAFHPDQGLELIRKVRKEDVFLCCRPSEMYAVYSLAGAQQALEGDYAEVGVYKGATARLICQAKGEKALHLFDTFEGLPELSDEDIRFAPGMFASRIEQVQSRLDGFNKVFFYKGLFPTTAEAIRDKRFAFVHLDVDIYQSTKDALEFFYPRMVRGGIIISHDFPSAAGVQKAFAEFLSHKPEKIIGLPLSQGMIVKQD
jgi:O-methyltransferase